MPGSDGRAVVLGAGGVVGTAWMAGLAAGLRRGGVDLAEADLIIGTSAGAIIGALLATGGSPDRLETPARPAGHDGTPLVWSPAADPHHLAAVTYEPNPLAGVLRIPLTST